MGAAARTRLEKAFPARASLGVLVAQGPASLRMAMVASLRVGGLATGGGAPVPGYLRLAPPASALRARPARDRSRLIEAWTIPEALINSSVPLAGAEPTGVSCVLIETTFLSDTLPSPQPGYSCSLEVSLQWRSGNLRLRLRHGSSSATPRLQQRHAGASSE
jgi:hypothetical protein